MAESTDPLEGQELSMLNTMLSQLWPSAKTGNTDSIDRVLKILALKRRYKEDRAEAMDRWQL